LRVSAASARSPVVATLKYDFQIGTPAASENYDHVASARHTAAKITIKSTPLCSVSPAPHGRDRTMRGYFRCRR
jgi:hypothetical protein